MHGIRLVFDYFPLPLSFCQPFFDNPWWFVMPNDREEKIQEVLMIFRHRNFMRYGVSDVDEGYVRSLRDSVLDDIIERDRILRERGY